MQQKKIKIFDEEYKYTEHKGIIKFPSHTYIKILDKKKKGDPTLEAIHKFDKMGYNLITESFLNMYFKKKQGGNQK